MITAAAGKTRRNKSERAKAPIPEDQIQRFVPHNDTDRVLIQGLSLPKDDALVKALRPTPASADNPLQSDDPVFGWESVGVFTITLLERHPDNRHPSDADVAAMKQSLATDGQLEPLVLRRLYGGRYQILSGETRWLAARALGWERLKARVVTCDDARALELLVAFNAHRQDLNPMQQARLIVRLCDPKEKQGAGLTREAAAKSVGLESGAAASNLVRLLELPQVWQDRVASGELAQSYAREIVKLAYVPEALRELESDWENYHDEDDNFTTVFKSRQFVQDQVETYLEDFTRALNDSFQGQPGYGAKIHADDIAANRKRLEIVTITRDGKEIEVATNVDYFDELLASAAARKVETEGKKKAAAAGKQADAGEAAAAKQPAKSKADLEREATQRLQQLTRQIGDWKNRLMRRQIAAAIRNMKRGARADMRLYALVLHFMCDSIGTQQIDLVDRLTSVTLNRGYRGHETPYSLIVRAAENAVKKGTDEQLPLQNIAVDLCAFLVEGDGGGAELFDDTLAALFESWHCDLEAAWRKLHNAKDPMEEEFYQLHRKDELAVLGKQLGVHFDDHLTKGQMVNILTKRPAPLPLPAALQPPKKRETKNKGRK